MTLRDYVDLAGEPQAAYDVLSEPRQWIVLAQRRKNESPSENDARRGRTRSYIRPALSLQPDEFLPGCCPTPKIHVPFPAATRRIVEEDGL